MDGKNQTMRAFVTEDGYCVEYRESLKEHAARLGKILRYFVENPG